MLKTTKISFMLLLPMLFIFCASLLGTNRAENEFGIAKIYSLPSTINIVAYIFYIFLIAFFSFLGMFRLSKKLDLYKPMLLLACAYFIMFFWSLITNSDQVRYFVIFSSVLLCPIGIVYTLERINLKFFAISTVSALFFLLLISMVYSFLNFSMFPRVFGMHTNPNLMGMWLISLLALVFYLNVHINRSFILLFAILITILVVLSGSRLAFVTLCILFIPYIIKIKITSLIILFFIAILSLLSLYISSEEINLGFRVFEVSSAVSDSGRASIWERAFECIASEPLTGHGMLGAESCVNIGNVHNSYLRVTVMLGIPLAIIFFFLFFLFLVKVIISPVSPFIKFYFLGLPLAFFAEDYIVGFSSPFFPFFIFMLALFVFDLKKSKS